MSCKDCDAARAQVSELEAALRELLTFSVRGHTVAEGTGEANGILQRVDAALATDKVETPEMSSAVAKAMDRFWRKCAEVDAAKADTDAPRHICEQCSGSGSYPEANACPVCAGTGWDSPVQADAPPTDADIEAIADWMEKETRAPRSADVVRRLHAHAKRLEILEAQGREHAKNCAIVETELRERAEAAENVLANDQHHGARVLDLACKLRAITDAHGELANRLAEAERARDAAREERWNALSMSLKAIAARDAAEAHLDREQKLKLLYADERDQLRAENAQLRGQLSGVCDCGAMDGDDHDDDCRVIQPAIAEEKK